MKEIFQLHKKFSAKYIDDDSQEGLSTEASKLELQNKTLTTKIFSKLSDWQIAQVARHPMRPYTLDYIDLLFTEFHELHGDRMYSDDAAIIGGLCSLDGIPIMLVDAARSIDKD